MCKVMVCALLCVCACSIATHARSQPSHSSIAPSREPLTEEALAELEALDEPLLKELHSSLRGPLKEALYELRARGWRARISRGKRTKQEQLEGFMAGYSKTLRSKHLCGKAADIMLHPHRFPEADHPFWDVKDEVVEQRGLKTLDVPSFRDRPHVELASDCDWDALEMGPVGEWVWRTERERVTLNVTRSARPGKSRYRGVVEVHRVGHPVERRVLDQFEVRYEHSGARNKNQRVIITARERVEGETTTRTRRFKVSTVTSEGNGYTRADWNALIARRGARFVRQ